MGTTLDEEYLTVAEAATVLRVDRSTVRRWIDRGTLPAYRVGPRQVRLRRADVAELITPVRPAGGPSADTVDDRPEENTRLTPEEQARGLAIVAEMERMHAELLAARGGRPFSPSWEIINEMRDERTRQLG